VKIVAAAIIGASLIVAACELHHERAAPPEFARWARVNATDPSAGLHSLAAGARVIGVGEATHGTSEFFVLKHRMLQYLVEHEGFNVFAMEANLPEAFAVNDYVLTGRGDPKQALAGLYFWTWDTYEVLDLIEWMRAWNADPAHRKVKFYGFDMQTTRVAASMAEDYVRRIDPAIAAAYGPTFALFRNAPANQRLRPGDDRTRELEQLVERIGPRASESDAGMRCIRVLQQAGGFARRWNERDLGMADNVEWILAREGPSAKVMLWAHNGHVQKIPRSTMGGQLASRLGARYVSIGFVFDKGSFRAYENVGRRPLTVRVVSLGPSRPGTLAAELATIGRSPFLLDLRRPPAVVAKWLDAGVDMRMIGSTYTPSMETEYINFKPRQQFDAIVFVDTMHPSHPTPTGERPPHTK
jgi:erythromycin esterase